MYRGEVIVGDLEVSFEQVDDNHVVYTARDRQLGTSSNHKVPLRNFRKAIAILLYPNMFTDNVDWEEILEVQPKKEVLKWAK